MVPVELFHAVLVTLDSDNTNQTLLFLEYHYRTTLQAINSAAL